MLTVCYLPSYLTLSLALGINAIYVRSICYKPCVDRQGVRVGTTTLTDLDLSYASAGLDDAALTELRDLPLKRLNLSWCRISDVGLAEIRGAPLEVLDLSYCELVSNEGVRILVSGKPLTKLELHGSDFVTEDVLPTLLGLPLVSLSLKAGQFSEGGLEVLKDAFPLIDLSIVDDTESSGSGSSSDSESI